MNAAMQDTIALVTGLMEEFNITEIRVDTDDNMVYISCLTESGEQSFHKCKFADLNNLTDEYVKEVDFTGSDEPLSDYDDPDMWLDGIKPVFGA